MLHLMQSRGENSSGYTKNTWLTITANIQSDLPCLHWSVHEMSSLDSDHAMTTLIIFSFSFYKIRFLATLIEEIHMNMMKVNYGRRVIHFADGDKINVTFCPWHCKSSLSVSAGYRVFIRE